MKTLRQFVIEAGSVAAAARKLGYRQQYIDRWTKSDNIYLVSRVEGKLRVIEVKRLSDK